MVHPDIEDIASIPKNSRKRSGLFALKADYTLSGDDFPSAARPNRLRSRQTGDFTLSEILPPSLKNVTAVD
jgi:hypothetical protein